MEFILILLLVAIVFCLCWLVDQAFTRLFRNQPQHKSGLSLRPSKRYGSVGIIIAFLGIAGILTGIHDGNTAMIVGSSILVVCGIGLVAYYLSTGIFYDEDSFVYTSFGKKEVTYHFRDIRTQKLYVITGGSLVVELHMADGGAISIQTTMNGTYPFLDAAFAAWCRQKGISPESCTFHDPENHLWVPQEEM